ncbi:hypothetical protein DFH29DRAFT_947373 [Suillus ampliporus]|nr:hypothetical protein DFH29DRAFT_947373 [Suillus ampliporus]
MQLRSVGELRRFKPAETHKFKYLFLPSYGSPLPSQGGTDYHSPPPSLGSRSNATAFGRGNLHNLLQYMYGQAVQDHVRWEVVPRGPPHALIWRATIYIDGFIYGDASACTRSEAQDSAAMMALMTLGNL